MWPKNSHKYSIAWFRVYSYVINIRYPTWFWRIHSSHYRKNSLGISYDMPPCDVPFYYLYNFGSLTQPVEFLVRRYSELANLNASGLWKAHNRRCCTLFTVSYFFPWDRRIRAHTPVIATREISIYQNSNRTPSHKGQNCKFCIFSREMWFKFWFIRDLRERESGFGIKRDTNE